MEAGCDIRLQLVMWHSLLALDLVKSGLTIDYDRLGQKSCWSQSGDIIREIIIRRVLLSGFVWYGRVYLFDSITRWEPDESVSSQVSWDQGGLGCFWKTTKGIKMS